MRDDPGGARLRARRIFRPDGRSVIVAIDHGVAGLRAPALARPARLLGAVEDAGADCVLATAGMIEAFGADMGKMGVIMRLDGGPTSLTGRFNEIRPVLDVEDGLRLGADGVAVMGLIGTEQESESLEALSRVGAVCRRWGVPLLAEMLPGGWQASDVKVEDLAVAARVACELGATLVKLPFVGSAVEFRQVVEDCYRPIVVLGGGRGGDVAQRLNEAMLAGARGVAVGRDIWQARDPAAVTRRLVRAVHGEASVGDVQVNGAAVVVR